jgi:hypothetical protein
MAGGAEYSPDIRPADSGYSSCMAFARAAGVASVSRLFGQRPAATLALIQAAWPLAVGRELARRTEVLAVEGRGLRVRVPDARWRKVLHRMQPQILGQLRLIAGDLAPMRLGFTEGAVAGPVEPEDTRATGALRVPPEVPPAVAEQAASIADTEIRALFLRSAALYLERRKHA